MEHLTIKFGDSKRYDEVLEETRKTGILENGDLEIVTKENATMGGKSGAMITFTVQIKGKRRRVQAVTTLVNLANLFAACKARVEFENTASDNNQTH